jgi:hypothetical protein
VVGAGQIHMKSKLGPIGVHLTERVKSFEPALDEAQQRIRPSLGRLMTPAFISDRSSTELQVTLNLITTKEMG